MRTVCERLMVEISVLIKDPSVGMSTTFMLVQFFTYCLVMKSNISMFSTVDLRKAI